MEEQSVLDKLPKPVRDNIMVIIPGALFVLIALVSVFVLIGNGARMSGAESDVAAMRGELDIAQADAKAAAEEIASRSTGVDVERAQRDTETMRKALTDLFSWTSGSEYDAVRSRFLREHNLSSDSMFARTIIPEMVYIRGTDGKPVNVVDGSGLRMELREVRPSITSASDRRYDYLCEIDVASSTNNGREVVSTYAVSYGVTDSGELLDLYAVHVDDAK